MEIYEKVMLLQIKKGQDKVTCGAYYQRVFVFKK